MNLSCSAAGRWENRPGVRPAALDERGERGMEGSGGEALHFLYSPTGGLLAEVDAATGAVTREYVSLAGQPLALIADGQVLAVHPDRLGAPQAMTDASGALVWQASLRPFGEAEDLFEAASNDQRFPGQRLDAETGLHQNWFRDYDPTLGRYLQADPIGLAGGLNVYAYAGGNPVNRIDPDGLEGLVIGDPVNSSNLRSRTGDCFARCFAAQFGLLELVAIPVVADAAFPPLKPRTGVGGPGQSRGSSRLSSTLSDAPLTSRRLPKFIGNLPAPTLKNPLARSAVIGRVIGRGVPILGTGLLVYDGIEIGRCTLECADGECETQ